MMGDREHESRRDEAVSTVELAHQVHQEGLCHVMIAYGPVAKGANSVQVGGGASKQRVGPLTDGKEASGTLSIRSDRGNRRFTAHDPTSTAVNAGSAGPEIHC